MPAKTPDPLIERLYRTGHFASPIAPDAHEIGGPSMTDPLSVKLPKELAKLTFNDPIVKQALRSYQISNAVDADRMAFKHLGRRMIPDGDLGPASKELLTLARCAVPDFALEELPAQGSGNWKGCHSVGNFHAVKVLVIRQNMPAATAAMWEEIKRRVTRAYAAIGLLVLWTEDRDDNWNTQLTFVTSSAGWIGLATVMRNVGCSPQEREWLRLLASFMARASVADNTSLTLHELMHNLGYGHTNGGIGNPSIIRNLDNDWIGDPLEPSLRRDYGGQPVPIPDDTPGPTPPGPGPAPPHSPRPIFETRIVVPANCPPGTYDYISVPRPEV